MKPNRQSNTSSPSNASSAASSTSGQTVGSASTSSKVQNAGKAQHAVRENLKQFDSTDGEKAEDTATSRSAKGNGSKDSNESSAEASNQSSVEKFSASMNEVTGGVVEPAIKQAKEVYEHAKITFDEAKEVYAHIRETMSLGKSTLETCKSSASKALAYVRENPQPFLQAIVPGALGTFLLAEKFRGNIKDGLKDTLGKGKHVQKH